MISYYHIFPIVVTILASLELDLNGHNVSQQNCAVGQQFFCDILLSGYYILYIIYCYHGFISHKQLQMHKILAGGPFGPLDVRLAQFCKLDYISMLFMES